MLVGEYVVTKKSLLSACFIVILLGGFILAIAAPFNPVAASTDVSGIPKLSIPEFTLELVGPPYHVNTTYSLDPATGEVAADIGYTNPYSYVKLVIKNQPFDPSYGSLYYNVQIKNQNTLYENWTVVRYDGPNPIQTTDSEYTNISLRIEGQWGLPTLAGTQTDIQVEAMLGNFDYVHSNPPITSGFVFTGMTSGWSETQTISIPANTPLSSTPTPSPSPFQPQQTEPLEVIIGVAVAVAVIGAGLGLLIYLIKRK
jgi:hypothetical protein